MKAVRSRTRGGPETLRYEDAPEPRLGEGDALVRVHAAAITPTELTWNSTWTDVHGKDRRPIVPSFEVSGKVERVAPDVRDLAEGDTVYGLLVGPIRGGGQGRGRGPRHGGRGHLGALLGGFA